VRSEVAALVLDGLVEPLALLRGEASDVAAAERGVGGYDVWTTRSDCDGGLSKSSTPSSSGAWRIIFLSAW